MKTILIPLFLIFLSQALQARSVQGVLKEKGTGKPLSDINVFLMPLKLKATTNEEGVFIFEILDKDEVTKESNVDSENKTENKTEKVVKSQEVSEQSKYEVYELIINSAGFIKYKEPVDLKAKLPTIYLEKEYYSSFETIVRAEKPQRTAVAKKLTQKDFLQAPGAGEDPIRAVQNLPGVAANQGLNTQIVIQGSEPGDTKYQLWGHEIPIVFHFGGLTSITFPQAIDSVEYLAAGFGPEYGRANGGIINLNPKNPEKGDWGGVALIDTFQSGILAEGSTSEKGQLLIGARQSYIGKVIEAVMDDNEDFNLTLAPEYQDLIVHYKYDWSEKVKTNLLFLYSKDQLALVVNEAFGNDNNLRGNLSQETRFWRVLPKLEYTLGDDSVLNLSVAYGENRVLVNLGDQFFDLNSHTLSERYEWSKKLNEKMNLFVGLDLVKVDFNVNINLPFSTDVGDVRDPSSEEEIRGNVEGTNINQAVYYRLDYQINDEWKVSPNLRYARFGTIEKTYTMPRFELEKKWSKTLLSYLNTGVYYQPPTNGEGTSRFGNPDIESPKATHLALGMKWDTRGESILGSSGDAQLFYKDLDDIIEPTSEVNNGVPKRFDNLSYGYVSGVQLQWQEYLKDFNFNISYTYLNSRRFFPGEGMFQSEYDQTHNLNLMAIIPTKRWNYSLRLRYVTGNPFTPIEGGVYDADSDVYRPIRGDFFSERAEPLIQLDFRIDRKWIYNEWILNAYLDIQNITNNAPVISRDYSYDYSQSVEATGLGILPIFGVKGEF